MLGRPTEIWPRLWMGPAPPVGGELRAAGIDRLVLAAMEYQPPSVAFRGVVVDRFPIDDAALMRDDAAAAVKIAKRMAGAVRSGQTVLVTCLAGKNRSGLVTALTLRELAGISGKQALERVRAKRPGSLTNPYFAFWLSRLPAPA